MFVCDTTRLNSALFSDLPLSVSVLARLQHLTPEGHRSISGYKLPDPVLPALSFRLRAVGPDVSWRRSAGHLHHFGEAELGFSASCVVVSVLSSFLEKEGAQYCFSFCYGRPV